jgi:hypothetical protein
MAGKMTSSNAVCAIAGLSVLLAFALFLTTAGPRKVGISVAVGTNDQIVLTIKNPTTHVILFDDPRVASSAARVYWELVSGRDVVAAGGQTRVEMDPLLPAHISYGPVDVGPGRPLEINLAKYYPVLTNGDLIGKADTFLWYCRVWDMTAGTWVQASGAAHLRSK